MTKDELNQRISTLWSWAIQEPDYRANSLRGDIDKAFKDFDKARKPVADAAWFLFSVTQVSRRWLVSAGRTQIRERAKRNGEGAFKMGLPVSGPDFDAAMDEAQYQIRAIIESGLKGLVSGVCQKYIEISIENFDRERAKIADAAQFLWRVNTNPLKERQGSLTLCSGGVIRHAARLRQEETVSHVADAAWVVFDDGVFKADLYCAPSGRILELATRVKATKKARVPIGYMDIEGLGANGEEITVKGVVMRRADADGSMELISERLSKQYGVTDVTSCAVRSLC